MLIISMDRPLIAKIEYNHDCICSDVPERHPDTNIRYLAEIGENGDYISHMFNVSGSDYKQFIDSIRSHHTTADVKVLRKTQDSADIIAATKNEASTASALKESGCAFLCTPIYDSGIERIRIFAPSFGALRGFLDSLKNSYNVKVASKHFLKKDEKIRPQSLIESGFLELVAAADLLTKRQSEALSLAGAMGYYEMPKSTSLQKIADKMDISEAAAGELLRKAERRLLPTLAKIIELQS